MEKVIGPALSEYDYIVQDRGIVSGLAYGSACGNNLDYLHFLAGFVTEPVQSKLANAIYDYIIYLRGDVSAGLKKAVSAKQEFAAGDAMESRGDTFLQKAATVMQDTLCMFNTSTVDVDGKGIDEVFREVLQALNLEE
jgi:thymidylate kinase